MSLKAVHVFFVTIATLIAAGFGIWAVQQYSATGSGGDLLLTVLAVAAAISLPIYGVWFLKKTKHMGYV